MMPVLPMITIVSVVLGAYETNYCYYSTTGTNWLACVVIVTSKYQDYGFSHLFNLP